MRLHQLLLDSLKESFDSIVPAMASGKMIVGKKWLQESVKKGSFADGDTLRTTDASFERKHKFKLATSLSKVVSCS